MRGHLTEEQRETLSAMSLDDVIAALCLHNGA